MIEKIINLLNSKYTLKIILLLIALDVILGSIRALKEHKWNSTVGINGLLRKGAMIACAIAFILLDYMLKINLLFFLPDEINNFLHLNNCGFNELFGIMFILYEATSILKNMVLCGLPIPAKLKKVLENALKKMTTELDKKEV